MFANVFGSTLRSTVWLNARTVYPTSVIAISGYPAKHQYASQTMHEHVYPTLERGNLCWCEDGRGDIWLLRLLSFGLLGGCLTQLL